MQDSAKSIVDIVGPLDSIEVLASAETDDIFTIIKMEKRKFTVSQYVIQLSSL